MIEVCLNVKPFMQPHPCKNEGGDCFACALTAILQHLFPERPPKFETVWNYFMQCYYMSKDKGLDNSWYGLNKAISNASSDGYKVDHMFDLVEDVDKNEAMYSHAFYLRRPSNYYYSRRLEGWLRCGWLALADIRFEGDGAFDSKGQFNDCDHIVVLDGVREVWEDGGLENYIHVVCSVKGAYWINTRELLKKHGVGAWWLVRREVD